MVYISDNNCQLLALTVAKIPQQEIGYDIFFFTNKGWIIAKLAKISLCNVPVFYGPIMYTLHFSLSHNTYDLILELCGVLIC